MTDYTLETTASKAQLTGREKLKQLFQQSPLPPDDLLFNLGLYTRSSLLVKYLVLYDLYQKLLPLPGVILEIGTWWGQNMVLLENLRAILEPFNKQRKIVGFDTFDGYTAQDVSNKDGNGFFWEQPGYATGENYKAYLEELLKTHEEMNVLGHIAGSHALIEGDVKITVPDFLAKNPETIVAFAYFDIGLYEPTLAALKAIRPHLISGSLILFDELTWSESPGEAIALKEAFRPDEYTLEKIALYPSKVLMRLR